MSRKSLAAAIAPRTYIPTPVIVRGKRIRLHLHFDEAGGYWVDSPDLRGLVTQGETTDEALANGVDAALTLMDGEILLRKKHAR